MPARRPRCCAPAGRGCCLGGVRCSGSLGRQPLRAAPLRPGAGRLAERARGATRASPTEARAALGDVPRRGAPGARGRAPRAGRAAGAARGRRPRRRRCARRRPWPPRGRDAHPARDRRDLRGEEEARGDRCGAARSAGARVFALEAPGGAAPQARVVAIAAARSASSSGAVHRCAAGSPPRARGRSPSGSRATASRSPRARSTSTAPGYAEVEFPQEVDRVGRGALRASRSPAAGFPPAVGEVPSRARRACSGSAGDPGAAAPLVGLLRGRRGRRSSSRTPPTSLAPAQELAGRDVIVLDDVPAAALARRARRRRLRAAVGARGAGLLVLGGRKGLGSGEYADSPARGHAAGHGRLPLAAAAARGLAGARPRHLVLDGLPRRGARGRPRRRAAQDRRRQGVGQGGRADRAARRPARDPRQQHRPLLDRPARRGRATREAVLAQHRRGSCPRGDGIYFYSVLNEAREALRREPAGIRHVLVLCDAEDIDQYEIEGRGHSFDLRARRWPREGITRLGARDRPPDRQGRALPAHRGAPRPGRLLPACRGSSRCRATSSPSTAASPRRATSSRRRSCRSSSDPPGCLAGGPAAAPLAGVALVTPREGSRTLLQTDVGPPLLVAGDLRPGRTAVFTGDNG